MCWGRGRAVVCVLPTFLRAESLLPASRSSPQHESACVHPAQLFTKAGGVRHDRGLHVLQCGKICPGRFRRAWIEEGIKLQWAGARMLKGPSSVMYTIESLIWCWFCRFVGHLGDWLTWRQQLYADWCCSKRAPIKIRRADTCESIKICRGRKRKKEGYRLQSETWFGLCKSKCRRPAIVQWWCRRDNVYLVGGVVLWVKLWYSGPRLMGWTSFLQTIFPHLAFWNCYEECCPTVPHEFA